jgi:hypothetical protein
MKVEIINLTEENLKEAPEWGKHPYSCKYCIWWEFPEESIKPSKRQKEDMIKKKLKWLKDTRTKFGNCGKMICVNERPVGYSQYAPPEFLPRSKDYQSGPPSRDAVLISCLFIPNEEFRGMGLGSRVLLSIIAELRERGIKAVETFARKGSSENPSGPVGLFLRKGFRIFRDDPEFPLLRMEL